MSRPRSVLIISLVAIVIGLYSGAMKLVIVLAPGTYQLFDQFAETINSRAIISLPTQVHLIHGLAGSAVWVVSGWYMLKGRNWARLLALFWGLGVLLLTLATVGLSMSFYLKLVTYSVIVYFLTRQQCLGYFLGHRVQGS